MPSKLFLWTSDIFLAFICPSLPTVKVLVFIVIFVHVHQLWKFWFLLAFLSKSTNGESFDYFGHDFFYWPLWLWIPTVKFLWFGVCLWATSGIPLRYTRVRVRRRQSLAPYC